MAKNVARLQIEVRAVADLIPYRRNPRTHTDSQVAQIAASIEKFGWTNPILIGPDNILIAGHARWLAAQRLGIREVPVIVLDGLTAAERKALVIADNRLALNAGWDKELLRLELEELCADDFDLDLLGFAPDELEDLRDVEDHLANQDAAPVLPERAVTLPGDLWRLGRHHLLCGDATRRSDVDRLMSREQADLMFSDSPNHLDHEGYATDRLKIQGDRMSADQFRTFLGSAFASYHALAKPKASLYVCHLPQLLDDVERGETLIITRHGRRIARIVPEGDRRQEEVDKALAGIQELRGRTGRITVVELLSARDEGRKS